MNAAARRSLKAMIVAMVLVLAWRGIVARQASAAAGLARVRLETLTQCAQDVIDLRAKRPTTGMGPKPDEDLATLIGSVMTQAGLAESKLRSVTPEGETALPPDPMWPGVNRRRQGGRVMLEPISLPELGLLLQRWRSSQSIWTVTSLELSRLGSTPDSAYRVALSLSATYVDAAKRSR